jgi:polyvinyl alcohol dehydrogenase (cytochrome)
MRKRSAPCFSIAILIFSTTLVTRSIGQSGGAAPQNIVWSSVTNCTITGNSLQKTSGRTDSSDAGARSQQTVTGGDVYFEFTVGDVNKILFCGLTHAASGTAYTDIDFSVKLTDFGVAEIRENNAYGGETTCRTGDVFRIAVQGNVVSYYKNGGLYHTSSKAPVYPMFADAAFLTLGGRVDGAVIGALAVTLSASWTSYQHDQTHTGFSGESKIGTSNAASLAQAWSFTTGDLVTGTPLVADGVVYIGSWDGRMYALRERDGSIVWTFNNGTLRVDSCQTTYGIDSTAALSGGKLYFGTGLAQLVSLNAANGQLVWRSQLADPNQAFHIWGSPLVFDGKIYIGLASHCVNPCIVGRIVCVDASDGRVLWSFATAPDGSTGGAVWSSPAVDASRRMIYVGTGNFCTGTDLHSSAIIALNADTGALIWRYKRLPQGDTNNLDFGSSPVLYDVDGTPMLALPSKDGHCYGLNRATGALVWDTVVTDGNSRGGSIASPAAAYGKVFFGGTVQTVTGMFVALDQRDGHIVWRTTQSHPILGATAVAGGVAFVGCDDGALHAYDASTGAELWNAQRNSMLGGVSISTTSVLVGSLDHNVYAFTLPTTGPPPPASVAVTVNSPNAGDQWVKGDRYNVSWSTSGPVSRVDVSISRDGGSSWEALASGLESSAGAFEVKAKKPKSSTAVVRVTDSADSTVFGQSGMFSIR